MSDSFDTLVTLGEQIEAILEERDRLQKDNDKLHEANFHMRCALERVVGYLDASELDGGKWSIVEFARAALAKEAGQSPADKWEEEIQ